MADEFLRDRVFKAPIFPAGTAGSVLIPHHRRHAGGPRGGIARYTHPMKFTKMHGIGNDYVYVNGFDQAVADPGDVARRSGKGDADQFTR